MPRRVRFSSHLPSWRQQRLTLLSQERVAATREHLHMVRLQSMVVRSKDLQSPEAQQALQAVEAASRTPCPKYLHGACPSGSGCPFLHVRRSIPPSLPLTGVLHTWVRRRRFGFIRGSDGVDYLLRQSRLPQPVHSFIHSLPIRVTFFPKSSPEVERYDEAFGVTLVPLCKLIKTFRRSQGSCHPESSRFQQGQPTAHSP